MYSVPMIVALALYGASTALYMLFVAGIAKAGLKGGRTALAAGAAMHLLAIGHHHVSHHEPGIMSPAGLVSLGVFAAVVAVLLLGLAGRVGWASIVAAPLATVLLGTVVNNFGQRPPHMAVLKFVTPVHIVTSAIGFTCFGGAAVASIMMLVADLRLREHRLRAWPPLPSVDRLNRVAATLVNVGFPFYTLGIVLGAVWAYWAEGGLIPEYGLGVATWALFAVLVLLHRTTGWRGRRAAALIVLGFVATIPIVVVYALRRWIGQ
jgi:ABC-type uncharacterized transport system permease subunit